MLAALLALNSYCTGGRPMVRPGLGARLISLETLSLDYVELCSRGNAELRTRVLEVGKCDEWTCRAFRRFSSGSRRAGA
jgi:hypothetical protein